MDENVLGFQQRLDHRQHLLRIGIGEMKTPDLEILVILELGRRIGVNEHRVVADDFFLQLALQQNQLDRIFHRDILDENRGLEIRLHILVQQDIDAAGARQRLEHHLEIGIAELQGHRLPELYLQAGLCQQRFRRLLLDLALQQKRPDIA